MKKITAAQLRAARALLNISAQQLAAMAQVGVATVRRAEAKEGAVELRAAVEGAIIRALERAGVEFIDANGGGPGVRLKG